MCPKVIDARHHSCGIHLGQLSLDGRDIPPDDGGCGVGEPVGESGVGGQEEQAGSRTVEPANGDQPASRLTHQIEDGKAALRIAPGRHGATGFVQQDQTPSRALNPLTVDRQPIAFRHDRASGIADSSSVH
jgi:hypothetical protein